MQKAKDARFLEREKELIDYRESKKPKEAEKKAPSGYRWSETGDLEPIPGGPAKDKLKPMSNVSNVLSEISTYYKELQELGGIPDIEKGAGSNIQANIRASRVGQAAGSLFATKGQSVRQKILNSRPLLINYIRQASEMGARGMDSEKELEFYLSAATDPTKDVQSNLAAIKRLDEAYGLSSMMGKSGARGGTGTKPTESKKVGDSTWVKTDKGWVKQ